MSYDYTFKSLWRIPASTKRVNDAVLNTGDWTAWWKGLERVEIIKEAHGAGSIYNCNWRSASGYRLRTTITVTNYEPEKIIEFDSNGDLKGSGSFRMRQTSQGSSITINWNVSTTKPWMNLVKPLLRPLFEHNHAKLMKSGEAGLQHYLS